MRVVAAALFAVGLLLTVRVMFFGVRRARGSEYIHRAAPLSVAAVLLTIGALVYAHVALGVAVTLAAVAWVLPVGALAGLGAWWLVRASSHAAAASNDPDDDPRYRFQGHVAHVVRTIDHDPSGGGGRIALVVDGQRLELAAKWLPGSAPATAAGGATDSEVVIEHVEDDVAYVEPWALVESRL